MAETSKPSGAARLSILYITIGALMGVWTVLYYFFYLNHTAPPGDSRYFWCYGFFFTGLTLIAVGVAVGRIGRAARHAELPPDPLVVKPPVAPVPGTPPQAVTPAAPAAAVPVALVPVAPPAPGAPVRR
jgi:hypothetical protein